MPLESRSAVDSEPALVSQHDLRTVAVTDRVSPSEWLQSRQAPEFEADWRAAYRLLRSLRKHRAVVLESEQTLAEHLYSHWFHAIDLDRVLSYPTASAFRQACEPAFTLEEARLVRVEADDIELQTETGMVMRLPFGLVHAQPPQAPLRPGALLRARLMPQSEQGGFWHLWSRPWTAAPPARIHRYYLAARRGQETALAAALAQQAPADAVWYCKFLCGSHPQGRRDPALLYLPAGPMPAWLDSLIAGGEPWLIEQPLRLCRRLAPGVYRALDPGNGLSYGQHLAHAVARAALEPAAFASYARFAHPLDAFGSEL